jgi:putative phosphoribosyl transferase
MARQRHRGHESDVLFRDRADAGTLLANRIAGYGQSYSLVVGIASGGIVIAAEVARRLGADLAVLVVNRLRTPSVAGLTIGAVTASGHLILDQDALQVVNLPAPALRRIILTERANAKRYQEMLRESEPRLRITGRSVIVVDEGLATGMTMRAALRSIRTWTPTTLAVAVPVGSRAACVVLQAEVDELICLHEPDVFRAVDLYFQAFDPIDDDEVRKALRDARERCAGKHLPTPVSTGE